MDAAAEAEEDGPGDGEGGADTAGAAESADAESHGAETESVEGDAAPGEAGADGDESSSTDSDGDADQEATDADDTATDDADDASADDAESTDNGHQPGVPDDVQKYDRFKKVDGSQYDRVNEFLRDRTYITAREWAIARLCSDFRTETGVEMTKIGENLPELVPFMTDTYTPQAVNQARSSFEDKVRTAGATFLYGAMCDFFTAEELDDVMYEATEVAKFLLEVEGVELSVEDELDAEDRISAVMRDVRSSSAELRHERCPDCGAELSGGD
ncbi:DUF5806 family protein [Salinarchaeum laminariae]|uniref:DUF5806 family protein n=1 Tax=Salinarchaeum laminariae TaxID=869888 RepID=UPI0020C10FFA